MRACGLISVLALAVAVSSAPEKSFKASPQDNGPPADDKKCIYQFPNGQCISDRVLAPYALPDLHIPDTFDVDVAAQSTSLSDLLKLGTHVLRQNSNEVQTQMAWYQNWLSDLSEEVNDRTGVALDQDTIDDFMAHLNHFYNTQTKYIQFLVTEIALRSSEREQSESAEKLDKIEAHVKALATDISDRLGQYLFGQSKAISSLLGVESDDMTVSDDGSYIHLKLHNKTENAASSLLSSGMNNVSPMAIVAASAAAMAFLL